MQVPFFKLQKVFTLAETVFGSGQTVNGRAKEEFQAGRKVNEKSLKKTRSGDFILLRVLLFFSG